MLKGKTIIVGITGGIAAYKSAELVSRLVKMNAEVHVIMTRNACEFIAPLTMQTISRNPVVKDMFELPEKWEIEHIALARKADLFLIAPATANIIGKIACGIADDMLSTTVMAARAPVIFAPAMNSNMYENQIVQSNISKLKKVGYMFVEPSTGMLACGIGGKGRLADIDDIVDKVCKVIFCKSDLEGKTVLVTAGPTREYLDPVRYISNGSSGKMGYAVAKAAGLRGAKVILVSGPTDLKKPYGVETVDVVSAQEMYEEVNRQFNDADILVKAAAVSDYRPVNVSLNKIKKTENHISIEMEKNRDILKKVAERKGKRIVVGFSMETENMVENAVAKLKNKNLDMIVANDITVEGAGFRTDTNVVKIINKFGTIKEYPLMTKEEVANIILDEVMKMM